MRVTGTRDEFGIHQASYYQKAYEIFSRENSCVILMASYEGNPLAAIMVFRRGNRAWYFYGASNNQERNRMPTYLLQWEGMKWAASMGVKQYDLWGIPDGPEDALENQFTTRSDGLWGVYRFKRGFGGEVKRSAGVYQKILNQPLYALYQIVLKFKKSMVS
jgi:lipid II:glycine glycyltransferase (peptidoglycan interpeptide bridge formation enzyme)